jgi:hypothetical protein
LDELSAGRQLEAIHQIERVMMELEMDEYRESHQIE